MPDSTDKYSAAVLTVPAVEKVQYPIALTVYFAEPPNPNMHANERVKTYRELKQSHPFFPLTNVVLATVPPDKLADLKNGYGVEDAKTDAHFLPTDRRAECLAECAVSESVMAELLELVAPDKHETVKKLLREKCTNLDAARELMFDTWKYVRAVPTG